MYSRRFADGPAFAIHFAPRPYVVDGGGDDFSVTCSSSTTDFGAKIRSIGNDRRVGPLCQPSMPSKVDSGWDPLTPGSRHCEPVR